MKRKAKRSLSRQLNEVAFMQRRGVWTYDGMGSSMPPDKDAVLIYFDQKGEAEWADEFFIEHVTRGWKTPTGGNISNWKVCASEWIYNHRQEVKRRFRQSPFYSEANQNRRVDKG